jgi:rhomboid protease GluP
MQFIFRRDASLIFSGEIWRITTALFVQDGGLMGGIFNIIALLFIGLAIQHYYGKYQWLIIFFLGGILSELVAIYWQPIGAGNSVATFALAGSLLLSTLGEGNTKTQIISIIGILSGILLFLLKDIHGAALIIGLIIGIFINKYRNSEIMKRGG